MISLQMKRRLEGVAQSALLLAVSLVCYSSPALTERLTQNTEKTYRALLTDVIKRKTNLKVLPEDQNILGAAFNAVKRGQRDRAEELASRLSSRETRSLLTWYILRRGLGRADELRTFLETRKSWPNRWLMERRLERLFFDDNGKPIEVVRYFAKNKPKTDLGLAALASAHLKLNEAGKARAIAKNAWCGRGVVGKLETEFLRRFSEFLDNSDHVCRLDRFLIDNTRSRSVRRRRARAIRRVIKRLRKSEQKKARARLAAYLRQRVATKWLARIPPDQAKDDFGFKFQKVQHLRRSKKHAAAWALLDKAPLSSAELINPDAWWQERYRNARIALRKGRPGLAYRQVSKFRPLKRSARQQQAFFSGWLALKKLDKPTSALKHFERMKQAADGPRSASKAIYWIANAHVALKNTKEARRLFREGGKYFSTFHGQLSRQALTRKHTRLPLVLPSTPTDVELSQFLKNELVTAAIIAHKSGLARSNVRRLFLAAARALKDESQVALLAQLAHDLNDGQLEVRVGKVGLLRGFNLHIFAYPLNWLPEFQPLRSPPERALTYAVARQESEFNTRAMSGAGARGLMQVMPATARQVCREYRIRCRRRTLRRDPVLNTRIGAAYLADRIDDFNGSYVLALTGYNAGPGRTRQWLRTIGDPRSQQMDTLDWIYRIPFEETRTYTQKVLANVQVYRARLGRDKPLRLLSDLNRGS